MSSILVYGFRYICDVERSVIPYLDVYGGADSIERYRLRIALVIKALDAQSQALCFGDFARFHFQRSRH